MPIRPKRKPIRQSLFSKGESSYSAFEGGESSWFRDKIVSTKAPCVDNRKAMNRFPITCCGLFVIICILFGSTTAGSDYFNKSSND